MSDLLIGGGQGPLGDLSGLFDASPPVVVPPIPATQIDFTYSGGLTTGATLALAGAGNAAVGGRVKLTQYTPSGPPPIELLLSARHTRVGSMGSHTTLDESFGREWTNPLIDVGTGNLRMLGDDPDLGVFQFDGNDLVQFLRNGKLDYTVVVETPENIAVDPGEEAAQGWTIGGRGHLSLIERAVVYPVNGIGNKPSQEDRIFNWTNPDYDDSAWTEPHIITYVLWVVPAPWGAGGPWGALTGTWDAAFSDKTAALVWTPGATTNSAPVGKVYFRWPVTVPTTKHYFFQAAADNRADWYLDGSLIASSTGWETVTEQDILVSAGTHTLACVAENEAGSAINPAAVAFALYGYGYPPITYAKSGDPGKMLAYPATVPGMMIGKDMRLLVDEAQARGALSWLTLMFTDTHDSDGIRWRDANAEASTKVGTDYLTVFSREWGETYVDLWMPPGSTKLYAWNKGGRGGSSGITLAPSPDLATPGNLTGLTHTLAT